MEAYDRNQNFGNVTAVPELYEDQWPADMQFRQLTSSHRGMLPVISTEVINRYFSDVPTATGSVKSVDKRQQLVDSGRVAGCSFATDSSSLYFTGFVKAAMKKKVMKMKNRQANVKRD